METARELTYQFGAVLIFDEVIFKLKQLLAHKDLAKQNKLLRDEVASFRDSGCVVCASEAMIAILDMVDRIAILPGQLTAYDSGGLEILALRREAEAALGDDFDIREFHDRVLENGTIPLGYLRQHIESWIEEKL